MGLDDGAIRDLERRAYESYAEQQKQLQSAKGSWRQRMNQYWPPRMLAVRRRWGGAPSAEALQDGDVVLSIDGRPVHSFREVELACSRQSSLEQTGCAVDGTPQVSGSLLVELLRDGKRQMVRVGTVGLQSDETRRVLLWAGAALQETPAAVARQRGTKGSGVYVANTSPGSPAAYHHLVPTSRIVEVDGKSTPELGDFLEAVRRKKHGESLRIRQEDLRGASSVSTIKLDLKYWPTYEITKKNVEKSSQSPFLVGAASDGSSAGLTENRYTWRRRLLTPDDPGDGGFVK